MAGRLRRAFLGGPSNLPAFQAGTFYLATTAIQQGGIVYTRNTSGISGASFAADAANWTALGGSSRLGVASITSNSAAITGTSYAAISGLSYTATTGSKPIVVEATARQVENNNATVTNVFLGLFEDATQIGEAQIYLPASQQFGGSPLYVTCPDRTPTPGSHVYTLQAKVGAGGQGATLMASVGGPALIRVTQP